MFKLVRIPERYAKAEILAKALNGNEIYPRLGAVV